MFSRAAGGPAEPMPHANLANDEPMDGVALPGTPAGYAEVLIAEPEPVYLIFEVDSREAAARIRDLVIRCEKDNTGFPRNRHFILAPDGRLYAWGKYMSGAGSYNAVHTVVSFCWDFVARSRKRRTLMDNLKVLAGTWGEAVNWCYAHNLDRPDGRSGHPEFIDDKRMVMGLRNGMYVKIGTYYKRTDCLDIEEELKRRGFTEVEV